jgi:aerobic-type carbon monoxide dehydrogenase small subunit (CoxS/CutS family)
VLLNGRRMLSCLTVAVPADGAQISTIENSAGRRRQTALADFDILNPRKGQAQ